VTRAPGDRPHGQRRQDRVPPRDRVGGDSSPGGTVPATLSLALGGAPSFGALTPGIAKECIATTTGTIVSAAGDASLSYSDPGHMTNALSRWSSEGPVPHRPVSD
jgi:hypothetical protein